MKERCAPSSNKMLPSVVVVADDTAAMAVFNKHTLVYIADRGAGVMVDNEAVSPVAEFLSSTVEVCCSGGVTRTAGGVAGTAGCVTGTDGCVVSARKA